MFNYILRRLALIVPTVIGISICAFAFVRVLPGDPILAMAGQHGVTPERYEILKEQFGYNLPIWQQYFNYIGGVLHGDFGASISTKRPVISDFLKLFPATVELSLAAMILGAVAAPRAQEPAGAEPGTPETAGADTWGREPGAELRPAVRRARAKLPRAWATRCS